MFNDGTVKPQQFSIDQGCGTDFSNYAWLWMPGYAPRVTPFRSGQIRRHHAFTMDASFNKMTRVSERVRFQVGLEAFNALNHNYYGRETFNTNPNDPNFGTILPAFVWLGNGYPRQIQVRMKVFW